MDRTCYRCGAALPHPDADSCDACLALVRASIVSLHAYLTAQVALEARAAARQPAPERQTPGEGA